MDTTETKNKGAIREGNGRYIFDTTRLSHIEAGTGYSTSEGPVLEGERIQVALITMKRGTGARPHSHPNEQWTFLLKGKARAMVADQPETIVGSGTLLYLPADTIHSMVALPDEDVVFFTCKDLSHGIVGMAADGKMSGPHYEPGFEPK